MASYKVNPRETVPHAFCPHAVQVSRKQINKATGTTPVHRWSSTRFNVRSHSSQRPSMVLAAKSRARTGLLAYRDQHAFYAVSVPQYRDLPPASFPTPPQDDCARMPLI